jgi:hypothetical protein
MPQVKIDRSKVISKIDKMSKEEKKLMEKLQKIQQKKADLKKKITVEKKKRIQANDDDVWEGVQDMFEQPKNKATITAMFNMYKPVYMFDGIPLNIKRFSDRQEDSKGNSYTMAIKGLYVDAIAEDVPNMKAGKFYNQVDNIEIINSFWNVCKKDPLFPLNSVQWFSYFNVKITSITPINKDRKTTKKKILNREHKDDAHKAIYSNYTKYGINKTASTFSQLTEQYDCEYVRKNFRPNSCLLTAIINKYHDSMASSIKTCGTYRYKELTYDRLCEILELESKSSDIGCSIMRSVKFFEKMSLGLKVFDCNMKLMYTYKPENKNKDIYSVMHVISHDNHIYMLNNNLDELKHRKHKELKKIDMEVLTNDTYYTGSKKEVEVIKMVDSMDDCVKTIQTLGEMNEDVSCKFLCNNTDDLLYDCIKKGFVPKVSFNKVKMIRFTFQHDKVRCMVEKHETSADADVQMESVEEYKKYHKIREEFESKIITDEVISQHHPSVLEIEQYYKISPHCDRYIEDIVECNGLDRKKAYPSSIREIKQVPVFSYFDVYKKYDNHDIEDLTLYIVENYSLHDMDTVLLMPEKYCRLYGFALKKLKRGIFGVPYNVLHYRRPSKIVDVHYRNHIDKVFNSMDPKLAKDIVNITVGKLGIKENCKSSTHVFENQEDSRMYEEIYNGRVYPLKDIWLMNTFATCVLNDGFQNIYDMIIQMNNVKMTQVMRKLRQIGCEVYGIKTDCVLYSGNEKVIRKHFNMEGIFDCFHIERNKKPCGNYVKGFTDNNMMEITDFEKLNVIEFEDEYDTEKINQSIKKNTIVKADLAGCGKSTICKNYDKDCLFVCPYNVLCQAIRQDEFDSITLNNLLGFDIAQKKTVQYDVSDVKTICFDEIYLAPPSVLSKICKYMRMHPEIRFLATGDLCQAPPIGYRGKGHIIDNMVNILFPNQILLHENKRMKKDEDKEKLRQLKNDIFKTHPFKMMKLLKDYGFKTIKSYDDIKTKKNSGNAVAIVQGRRGGT